MSARWRFPKQDWRPWDHRWGIRCLPF